MAKLTEPVDTPLLSTHDVRERVKILAGTIRESGDALIARQNGYEEPCPVKIAFHQGRIAAAQTFMRLLSMTPEQWDAEISSSE